MGFLTPFLIGTPQICQTHWLIDVHEVDVVLNECVNIIRLGDHLRWTILGISVDPELPVDLTTMIGNGTQFESDLLHTVEIIIRFQRVAGRININQSPCDARLGVSDLHRLIRCHEQHRLQRNGVLLDTLFVDHDLLMCSNLIKQGVVPHVTQIAIGLDTDERRVLEGRGTELVSLAEFLRIEICDVSREEHLDDIENRRLSGSRITIDDEHLLDALNIITVDQGADAPFELFTFGRGI